VVARPRLHLPRRSPRPQYRYIIAPLETLFATAQRSADADRQADAIDRRDAARVLAGGLLILILVSAGMAVAIRQVVFIAMKALGT
jgi:hypothetical protein